MNKRWLKAQKKEKAHWAKSSQTQARKIPLSELRNLTEKARVYLEDLERLRILDIGSIAYADGTLTGVQTKLKIALDPLIDSWDKINDECEYICGIGKYIPLKQDSIDLCWC